MTIVQSLWIGDELSELEIASINSFIQCGHTFHLYVYQKVKNIPKKTIIKDGNVIIPKKEIFTLKNTFLPFADIFRYKMLFLKGNYWVDLDMICLKKLDFEEPYVFSSERTIQKGAYRNRHHKYIPNIGILKSPKNSDLFKEAYNLCMKHHKTKTNEDKLKYMKIFRQLISKYKLDKYVKPPNYFCPLDWWYAKDAFMPLQIKDYKSKYGVKAPTQTSLLKTPYTIHLWRDLVTKKYKLDLNGDYDSKSLYEILKQRTKKRKSKKSLKK